MSAEEGRVKQQRAGKSVQESAKYEHFVYKVSTAIRCDQAFRGYMMKQFAYDALIPFKTGEGKKYTLAGLLRRAAGGDAEESAELEGVSVRISRISAAAYEELKLQTMSKVFFKGFPPSAKKTEVEAYFGKFGEVQYVYFMCEPKKGKSPYRMGYAIFESRASTEKLLQQSRGAGLVFEGYKITVDDYKPNKKPPSAPPEKEEPRSAYPPGKVNLTKPASNSASDAAREAAGNNFRPHSRMARISLRASIHNLFAASLNSLPPSNLRFNLVGACCHKLL